MLCSANKQLICICLEEKRGSSWTQFQITDDHLIIGCTLVWLIHLVLWDLNSIIWKRRRCALPDILSSGSDRSAQKVSAADRSGFTAPYSCQRELLEEHLWVYNLSLWVENECWLRVRHTRVLKTSQCLRAHEPAVLQPLGVWSAVSPPLPEYKESLLSCAKSNTCDSERTHMHPGVHCRRVLVCLLAD